MGRPGRAGGLLVALGVLVAAAFLRFRTADEVFLEGRVLPYDPDSSYHLWRIEETVRTGAPPHRDFFVNAPAGARVIWPDGFDAAVGWAARLLHGPGASRFAVQLTALVAVPLLGLLAVAAAGLLAGVAFGRAAGLAAAAIAALLPAHVLKSMLGLVDHHVVELLLPPLALAALIAHGRPAPRAAAAAAALAGLVYAVPTAALHVAAVTIAAMAARRFAVLAASLGAAAALTLPAALAAPSLAFDRPSALPTLLLAAGGAAALLLALAERRGRLRQALALLALAGLAAAVALRAPLGFIGRAGILALVDETAPPWRDPRDAIELYSAAVLVLPVAAVAFARRAPALAAAAALGLALTAIQQRFDPLLLPAACALLGAALVALWPRSRLAALALAAAVAVPAWTYWRRITLLGPRNLGVLEACEWLRAHTPPAGDRAGPRPPDATVLVMWGVGAHFAYLGERPVLAGAFYHGDYAAGVADTIQALYGDGDPEPLLDRRRVRWVVVFEQDPIVEVAHRRLLGLGPPAVPTLQTQLAAGGGASARPDGGLVPARARYRLVHENDALKIFERVPGEVVSGGCTVPVVRAAQRVTTDRGRAFDFVNVAPCEDGRYEMRLPYPGPATVVAEPR